ncbi:MAG: hypothetical protein MI810_23475 [Flavobacteriales bacterium]|nr:hypothetical protein [Flavobacteriales bacterium]
MIGVRSYILTLFLLFSALGWTQGNIEPTDIKEPSTGPAEIKISRRVEPMNMHWLNKIDESNAYFSYSEEIQYHSSILPLLPNYNIGETADAPVQYSKNKLQFNFRKSPAKWDAKVYPITDLSIGSEIRNQEINPLYSLGIGAGLDFRTKKFFFTSKLLPYTNDVAYVADSIQRSTHADVGTTRPIIDQLYQRSEIMAVYRPHEFFTFVGGYGKNFFGDGYRSLLLSDNSSNHPYLKLETSFGSIKYVNLYNVWNDNSVDPSNKALDKMKFSAAHYLSWNVTRNFNIGVFETVVWQYNDTLVDRGFDINYLNPVVFYRPVEYGQGSADNVLLGLNTSLKLRKKHCIYGQMILDEFLLSEIRARSRWWGNKYGFQVGYKSNHFLNKGAYFQTEFNVVRPYTYQHISSTLSYGHLNGSVVHPIGANFFEVLNIVSFKPLKMKDGPLKELRITNKINWISTGYDTSAVNYGQNVFTSYQGRFGEFDQKIMQGLRTNILNENLILEVPLIKAIHLYANVTYNYRMSWNRINSEHQHYLTVGIRSRLWNRYTDF